MAHLISYFTIFYHISPIKVVLFHSYVINYRRTPLPIPSCCKAIPSRHAFHRQMLNGVDLEGFRPLPRASQLTRVIVPCTVDETISGQPPAGNPDDSME